jgi:putative tricarboxylic transport membrane protein
LRSTSARKNSGSVTSSAVSDSAATWCLPMEGNWIAHGLCCFKARGGANVKILTIAFRGEAWIALGLVALGAYILVDLQGVELAPLGYDELGPKLFPTLVGGALIVLGGALGWQAVTGAWRNRGDGERDGPHGIAFGVISAALVLHIALIGSIGFVLASVLLFVLSAHGLGSRSWKRDVTLGAAVSLSAYYLFTTVLGLQLTNSPFGVF